MAITAGMVAQRLRRAGWHAATVRGIRVVHSGFRASALDSSTVRVYWHPVSGRVSPSTLAKLATTLREGGFETEVRSAWLDVTEKGQQA